MLDGYSGKLVWDLRSDRLVATLAGVSKAMFVKDRNLLIGIGAGILFVYSFPDMVLLREYAISLEEAVLVPGTSWILGLGNGDRTMIRVFDYVDGLVIIDSMQVALGAGGDKAQLFRLAMSQDGAWVYAFFLVNGTPMGVVCYDIVGDSVRFSAESGIVSSCTVSPGGEELWLTEIHGFERGPVRVINAKTGQFVALIPADQLGRALGIVFNDERETVYINSVSVPPIHVVTRQTYEIEGGFAPTPGGIYESLAISKMSD